MDHFERLGLPRRFHLDDAELERQYLARSREVHPDYFQLGGELEQRASLEASAALNAAVATLRDPFRRADYLLHLQAGPTAADVKEVPAPFLEEMLELRMAIEEIKDDSGSAAYAQMEKDLAVRREKLLTEVGERFTLLEGTTDRPKGLKEIRQLLNATKYIQGLIRDLHAD